MIKRSLSLPSIWVIVALALLLPFTFATGSKGAESPMAGKGKKRNILYINSYQNGYIWSDTILDGIRETFVQSGLQIDLQVEYLDAKKHPDYAVREQLRALMAVKFRNIDFDAVIVSDNDAFSFALDYRQELFPGVPLVFCGVNHFDSETIAGQAAVTGVLEHTRVAETLKLAMRLHPGRKRLLVIGDESTTSVAIEAQVRDAMPQFKDRLTFDYRRVNNMEELTRTVETADRNTIIYHIPYYMDEGGTFLTPWEVEAAVAEMTDVPIYSGWVFLLGHGMLGGMLLSGEHQGHLAAQMVLDILAGKSPDDIPVLERTDEQYYFDNDVLARHGIPHDRLPAGSIIINQPKPFYELEKPVFWTIMASLGVLTAVLFFLALNIRQRKYAERRLKDQLYFMELLMDTIPTPIYFRSKSGAYTDFNKAFQRWFGTDRDALNATLPKEIKAAGGSRLRNPATLSDAADKELLARPGVRVYEQVLESIDGKRHNVLMHKATYRNASGEVEGLVGVLYDFTDRHKAEEDLRRAEEKYRSIFENSALGIFRVTAEGDWLDANPALAHMLGYATPVALMTSGRTILADLHCAELEALAVTAADRPGAAAFECRLTRADGQELAVRAYLRSITSEDGSSTRLEGIVEDVTSRRKAERDLRDSQKMLRMVLDNIPQLVFWKDKDLRYMGANKSFADFFGLSDQDEIIGKTNRDLLPRVIDALAAERLDAEVMHENRSCPRTPLELKMANGEMVIVELTKLPLHDYEGRVIGVLSTAEDVTRKVSLERQLLQSQKMEAIGTFVSGIAHDFNNILTTIINSAELALLDLPEESEPAEDVRRALNAAQQGSHLVSQIHTYSRPTREGFLPTEVAATVQQALGLIRASLPGNIRLREDVEPSLGLCLADPTQLRQVVMNLCTNAFQALRETGGVIEVGLHRVELQPERADLLALAPGEFLCLSVSDNGPGIPPSIASKIFYPFFTTKSMGEGTGLGLAVVQGIVKGHKGAISLSSEPWVKTRFEIFLPYEDEGAQPKELAERPTPSGSERILFVEDDLDQLETIPKVLGRLGYSVVACRGADAALAALSSSDGDGRFDLVVTDFDMPEATGVDFSRTLHQIRPGLPVILVSGRRGAIDAAMGVSNIRHVLTKPYSGRGLSEAIRAVLDAVPAEV
ncbi:signal transduction histidine kinase, nitrogen specific, NtrB [Desulfocurvibacter africanus subsp. africanus str. Walvis Bay]|uniref:histidine kinase n=3 Tax=Desulfocurvibacter africanus TaxID=873 RepID=F3YWM3_DESAF|nr:signal transduction histidine kinase, nitrogen specific, NtrB [Desulfocurvibacter africanus subsp. africanus str. Walvis Bay]